MRPIGVGLLSVLVLGGALGCGESCEPGEEWCDEDLLMVCVDGEDADWDEEEDDGLWELIDLALPDNYGEVKRDCAAEGKTCSMRTDSHGRDRGYCWYDQTF